MNTNNGLMRPKDRRWIVTKDLSYYNCLLVEREQNYKNV